MEMKECRHCKSQIDARAGTCPACGQSLADWPIVVGIIIVASPCCICLFMAFLGSLSGG